MVDKLIDCLANVLHVIPIRLRETTLLNDVLERNDNFFKVTDLSLHKALLILELCLEVTRLGLENFDFIIYWALTCDALLLFTLNLLLELADAHVYSFLEDCDTLICVLLPGTLFCFKLIKFVV